MWGAGCCPKTCHLLPVPEELTLRDAQAALALSGLSPGTCVFSPLSVGNKVREEAEVFLAAAFREMVTATGFQSV